MGISAIAAFFGLIIAGLIIGPRWLPFAATAAGAMAQALIEEHASKGRHLGRGVGAKIVALSAHRRSRPRFIHVNQSRAAAMASRSVMPPMLAHLSEPVQMQQERDRYRSRPPPDDDRSNLGGHGQHSYGRRCPTRCTSAPSRQTSMQWWLSESRLLACRNAMLSSSQPII